MLRAARVARTQQRCGVGAAALLLATQLLRRHVSTCSMRRAAAAGTAGGASASASASADDKNRYAYSIRLPQTLMPTREAARVRERRIQSDVWGIGPAATAVGGAAAGAAADAAPEAVGDRVYRWQASADTRAADGSARPTFVLHDGPPYANGRLHIGHFLNKTLKDFVNRYKLLRGYRVLFTPGWDCHGLPIEQKALERAKAADALQRSALSAMHIRSTARQFAAEAISAQRAEFQRWGVMADWARPYFTYDAAYEALQLDVFRDMFARGLVYRGLKPVNWSPSSRTALAEAELEYVDNHLSHSVYVGFTLSRLAAPAKAAGLERFPGLRALIWSTTPWTLPANQAVALNATAEYCVVEVHAAAAGAKPQHYIVAAERVAHVTEVLTAAPPKGGKTESAPAASRVAVVARFPGSALADSAYDHPFLSATDSSARGLPFLFGAHVTMDAGTGLVHTAPGHGDEDYELFRNTAQTRDTPIKSPVDDDGCFTADAGGSGGDALQLKGLFVLDAGNRRVVELLRASGALLKLSPYRHRYPYDWRTKKPVIMRSTRQWFARLDGLQDTALSALNGVAITPAAGLASLQGMVASRKEWCISRQRHWGVPIPVFYDETGQPLLTDETIRHVQGLVARHGTDCWFTLSVKELLPARYHNDGHTYAKGADTLDVWFDSGVSWRAALEPNALRAPSDLVIEGADQHRGWFNSSLLTCVAVTGAAPYRAIVTHGFTMDESGRKMSKSVGNTIDPSDIIDGRPAAPAAPAALASAGAASEPDAAAAAAKGKGGKQPKAPKGAKGAKAGSSGGGFEAYGVDVLRLWVGGTDYSHDIPIGRNTIEAAAEALRVIRGAARFMLGCLNDFDARHRVPYAQLEAADQYVLHRLHAVGSTATAAYDTYAFQKAVDALKLFTIRDLNSQYLDACKDRLYLEPQNSRTRRACQTVLAELLQAIAKIIAPIACHTAEDIYQFAPPAVQRMFGPALASSAADAAPNSVFARGWLRLQPEWVNPAVAAVFEQQLLPVRATAERCVGVAMQHLKLFSAKREAAVTLELFAAPPDAAASSSAAAAAEAAAALTAHAAALHGVLMVSATHTHTLTSAADVAAATAAAALDTATATATATATGAAAAAAAGCRVLPGGDGVTALFELTLPHATASSASAAAAAAVTAVGTGAVTDAADAAAAPAAAAAAAAAAAVGGTLLRGRVAVRKQRGDKCLRCWKVFAPADMPQPQLCTRCAQAVAAAAASK